MPVIALAVAGIAAFVILMPRRKNVASDIRFGPGSVSGLIKAGDPSTPAPNHFGLNPQSACGVVTNLTTKYVTGSSESAMRAGSMDQRIANPVCYANAKVLEYGVQYGKSAYDWTRETAGSAIDGIKSIF